MSIFQRPVKKKGILYFSFLTAVVSLIFLILSFLSPLFISTDYYQKSLRQLRSQKKAILTDFASLIDEIQRKKEFIATSSLSRERGEIFKLFKELGLKTEIEGIGYYTDGDNLTLWMGNVVDFMTTPFPGENRDTLPKEATFIIKDHKASVYLAALQRTNQDDYFVLYRLLAFIPQFKTTYLKEYHFLKPKLLSNLDIQYWDFREDVAGFDRLFSRHEDEYFSQPRPRDEIRTMLFPLRNETDEIVATVTLSPPSLLAKTSSQKENHLFYFYLFLAASFLSLLIFFIQSPSFYEKRKPLPALLVILILIGLRLIFFSLSNLEKVRSLPVFSPSSASFFSVWSLTKSPADIFLTSFILFLIAGCVVIYSRKIIHIKRKKTALPLSLVINSVSVLASVLFVFLFQEFLFQLVSHSNINLLHFSFNLSFFLLHLSIFFLFCVCLILIFISLRTASIFSPHFLVPVIFLIIGFTGYSLSFKEINFALLFLLQALVLFSILLLAFFSNLLKKKEAIFSAFLIFVLFLHTSLYYSSNNRNKSLIQNSLQNIIKYQEHWGNFLLNQSFPEIDKREESIVLFFESGEPPDFAHSLWERTAAAKFNWYSSLEILNPEGEFLSRFALNVPELYNPDFNLPISQDWSISLLGINILGQEKDFILGYKDWLKEEEYLGRTVLYLSIDYDMLPFLYSANPYFELLRVTSIPSLNRFDLGFVIFDDEGKLLFNPNNISSGIPPDLLEKINSQEFFWSSFTDKEKTFTSFYFTKNNRIYSLFIPQKNFYAYSTELLRLFFFYLAFLFLLVLFVSVALGKKFKSPLWSFSNRVYISFVVIALVPLFLFTFFTRSFFTRIFTQQFTEKAEIHANFVQRLVEDFILVQQEEMISLIAPPENVILSISSIISSDVNLYLNGRLISSSRREFFDYGLLPNLIDGEIYYKIQYENNPFYTQTQKIGEYSFHTLTTSYLLGDSLLLISLPFPLEQQEISKATEELIEFLFFSSVFFIGVVLVFARGIGSTIVTPIKKLLIGTKEVSMGNLDISIPHRSQDEMKTLIDGFNTMIKSLKKHQQELAYLSKRVAWTEMARKVAHEIKNPLTPIQLSAEHLLRVYKDKRKGFAQALEESASYIINEVQNLRKIAQDFLEISKESALKKEHFDLKELLEETISPYKKMLSDRIKFRENYKCQDFRFYGDKDKMRIALRNIFINAIEAIEDKGKIEIVIIDAGTEMRLEIRDTGIGMEKKMLDKIFEPNFSTKDLGTGLGLPISKKIIEDHGGTIQASSQISEGTKISINLPKQQ